MRDLFFQLQQAGFNCLMQQGGLIVTLQDITIVFGSDENGFLAYVQEDLEAGPKHTSLEALTQAQAIDLCQSYVKTVEVDRPELV